MDGNINTCTVTLYADLITCEYFQILDLKQISCVVANVKSFEYITRYERRKVEGFLNGPNYFKVCMTFNCIL